MGLTNLAALVCMAGFTVFSLNGTSANAAQSQSRQGERTTQPPAASPPASAPLLAVIALAQQRVTIYNASGKVMEGPVSTGATGHETPAGIYSILEKEEEHHSNLYDDASMPFMQRLTWTGISMHAGVLPGYPASHGCTRLSYNFAQKLYQITKPGMRVVIVREDIVPAEIEQPEMFNPTATEASPSGIKSPKAAELLAIKEEKLAEAEAAKNNELKARSFAAYRAAEALSAARLAETSAVNLARLEAAARAGDRPVDPFSGEAARIPTAAEIKRARLQLERAKLQAQAKKEAVAQAEEEVKEAAALSVEAAEAAEIARQNAWPISIFISRKAQRLYIRKGREPIFEGPVTIRNPDKPIGTFVFTALNYTETPEQMRWSVVSMYKNATAIEPYSEAKLESKKRREAARADVAGARNAMQRLVISQEALEYISGALLPGASLIISDEGASSETGKDTDFITFMTGEPQGGATFRSPVMADAAGEGRRGHKRRAAAYSRPRHQAARAAWPSRGFAPFPSFFGF